MAFSPDGLCLALLDRGTIKLYHLSESISSHPQLTAFGGAAAGVVMSPFGTTLVSGPISQSGRGNIAIWDVPTMEVIHQFTDYWLTGIGSCPVSDSVCIVDRDSLKMWNILCRPPRLKYSVQFEIAYDSITSSNNGSKILVSSMRDSGFMLELRDARSGQLLVTKRFSRSKTKVIGAAFSRDDSKLVIARAAYDGTQCVLEVRDGQSLQFVRNWKPWRPDQMIGRLAFSKDGRLVVLDVDTFRSWAWDFSTGHTEYVRSSKVTRQIAFVSRDGSWILTPEGTRALYIPVDYQPVESVRESVSIQGNTIAIGNDNGHVTVMGFDSSQFKS
ncbi:WD40-repeat-containing domain protein [Aspergillus insuetus]